MRSQTLFFNGVFEAVLENIANIQLHLPEQILYLQPYSGQRIVYLAENPPTIEDPVRLFASLTTDLPTVHYVGEIVGWNDKMTFQGDKLLWLNRIIYCFQWTEHGVYQEWKGGKCKNLLYVRRLRKLAHPFSVGELTSANTGQPLSTGRTRAGGWVYVVNPEEAWLQSRLGA